MHEINFGLAGKHACVRHEDILILLSLFCCVELVRIYNAGKMISVNISSSLLYYCSPFFTELIGLRFRSCALANSFTFSQEKKVNIVKWYSCSHSTFSGGKIVLFHLVENSHRFF